MYSHIGCTKKTSLCSADKSMENATTTSEKRRSLREGSSHPDFSGKAKNEFH